VSELGTTTPELAHVIGDAPAAVLLVDLERNEVVHANDVALQLAPGVTLPVSLDQWGRAAQLRDPAGAELAETAHPLSRLGRREQVPGQAVSAARASDLGESREPLWVVGLPIEGAPGLQDTGLVVLLSIREQAASNLDQLPTEVLATDSVSGDDLHQRAVLATGLSFTVADARAEDMPLVWVNPAFTATTGYDFDETVGHNCRFLQGQDTSRESVARLREALRTQTPIVETLLNYRKDGLPFWNQVTMSPIHDAAGEVTHVVGVQNDVSGRIEADRLRDQALRAAREARAEAEQAQDRLQLLSGAAERLTGALDADECRRRLLDVVVPAMADMAVVLHVDTDGAITDWEARHRDPALSEATERVVAELPDALRPGGAIEVLLDGAPARLMTDLASDRGRATRAAMVTDEEYVDHVEALAIDSTILAVMPGRSGPRDLLVLNRSVGRTPFDERDTRLAVDLGRRAGLIFDNARLYQSQQRIAETLQISLLPRLTALDRAELAARYLPGTSGARVGGDFYDLTELSDGSLCLVVGDVIGHDVMAAAAMGQLKGMIWALAHDPALGPAAVLERVDALASADDDSMASVLLARITATGDGWQVRSSSAGHPPLAVRRPDGAVELVEAAVGRGRDPLIGLGHGTRSEHVVEVPTGSTVVAFTDGLVERRGDLIDTGLDRLRDELATGPLVAADLCDHLVDRLVPADHLSLEDDVALLVARLR